MRQTESFTPEELKKGQRVIIYGAGRYGELALRGLQHLGIQPFCFADKALAGTEYYGVPVIAPGELENYRDDIVLIASYNHFGEMLSSLRSYGCRFGRDMLSLLTLEYDESVLSEYTLEEKQNPQKYANAVNMGGGDVVITHCELVLTERCTLKCRDCANLMQYYERPEQMDIDELILTFHRFLQSVDGLVELRLLGGEPFLCTELDRVLKEFLPDGKIGCVTIYTNSTILPKAGVMESLKNEKVSVHLSDYGLVSGKLEELKKLFQDSGVKHYVHRYEQWSDFGGVEARNHTLDRRNYLYKTCVTAKCHTFYRGKLYVCPRAAHGERLGAFVNPADEIVDFTGEAFQVEKKREEVRAWLKSRDSIIACEYCDGFSKQGAMIQAAVQMPR